MAAKVEGVKVPFVPIGGIQGLPSQRPLPSAGPSSFEELLKAKLGDDAGIKFSAHARTRIESRNIAVDGQRLEKLTMAVEKAADKGARESLILMDDAAFIVSVENRTVITAVDRENLKENVFTNIDSAIIVE